MKMANFWIIEKQYIHKLFKVLAPRFQNYNISYTRMYKAPQIYPNVNDYKRAVLELRGNPYPSLKPDLSHNRKFIHNILLEEARKEYRKEKYAEFAEKLAPLSEAKQSETQEANASDAAAVKNDTTETQKADKSSDKQETVVSETEEGSKKSSKDN